MQMTYANITSTIALFAALTTGTTYAATTLQKDSVSSQHVRDGQIQMRDLSPAVRARLTATRPRPTTSTTTLQPMQHWFDTRSMPIGQWTEASQSGGTIALHRQIGTTGQIELRLTGQITKPAGEGAMLTLTTRNAAGQPVGSLYAGTGIDTSGTLDAAAFGFGGSGSSVMTVIIDADKAHTIEVRVSGKNAVSTLRIEARRVSA